MRRTICFFLILSVVLAAFPAFASTVRYCPVCDTNTTWNSACSLTRYGASPFGKCGDVENCNWYSLYRYDGEKCNICGNRWTLSSYHACKGIHSVTSPYHDYLWCPWCAI